MVIFLIGYLFGRGGIQTHTHYLAEGLQKRGHSVTVLSPPAFGAHSNDLAFEPSYHLHVYSSIADIAALHTLNPDVAVVCGTGWKAMLGVLCLPRRCRRVFFEVMSGRRTGMLDPRDLSHLGFDAIVGQATAVERAFGKSFVWRGQSETIPALPQPLELSCEIPMRVDYHRDVGSGIRYVYFGRLATHKGIMLLIDRWRDFSAAGSSLDIFGGGPEGPELERKIVQSGLSTEIRILGQYPTGRAYIDLMQQYDLMLLPTYGDEGAPLVLLEAMACGLPFVANGVGGIPDYVNIDCMITDGNIENFFPTVCEMNARIRSGEINPVRLQTFYQERFSYERLVVRWERFLLRMANQRETPPQ